MGNSSRKSKGGLKVSEDNACINLHLIYDIDNLLLCMLSLLILRISLTLNYHFTSETCMFFE